MYPVSIELDGPVELVCTATLGSVEPVVVWYDPSGNVVPSDSHVTGVQEVNVTVSVNVPGRYLCEVTWGDMMMSESATIRPGMYECEREVCLCMCMINLYTQVMASQSLL